MEKIIVGVDAGTTAVKAVAFNLNGEILNAAHRSVPVNYGRRGEAEQDLNQIWEAVADALAELTSKTGDHEIVGVGLTGQGDGAWLLDKEHKPLRPAAIWMDGRAGKRVAQWQQDGRAQRVLEVTGTTIFPALVPILLDEFEAEQPGFLAQIGTLFHCKDWIRYNLTGELATDYTEASRSFFNVVTGEGHDAQLAADLGLDSVLSTLPKILAADESGGTVTPQAAERTGLPAGIPVSVGMIDVAITGPGLGAIKDGDSWLILGTTGRNIAAGMSGGVAYVYDAEGTFESRCNMAQVALEPVEDEIAARKGSGVGDELESHGKVDVRHLGLADEVLLKGLIEKHAKYTGSLRARRILDDWSSCRGRFVKVMPHEYRRALTEMAVQKMEKSQQEAA